MVDESDPERRLARIGMQRIEIGEGALAQLPDAISGMSGDPAVALVMDDTPMHRDGQDLKQAILETLRGRFDVSTCWLGSPRGGLHVDEHAISEATVAMAGAGCVVAVGSGAITDVAKEASARLGHVPLVVVQTAASVNAFSDNMAVLVQSGVKRTVPSRWPDVLLIDLEVLASAPHAMNVAGFGDLLAIWTAPADWRLAALLGMDSSYHPCPVSLVRGQGEFLLQDAAAVGRGSLAGLARLASTLTISGIALGIAGSTAPLSGTEHLISHLIDMRATHHGEPLRLHGAQVGLAAVIAAELWGRFLDGADADWLDRHSPHPAEDVVRTVVLGAFSGLDPSGAIGEECWSDCRRKLTRWNDSRRDTEVTDDWESLRLALTVGLRTPVQLLSALRDAGAVTSFANLDPPVTPDTVRWAIERLPFMRERFTLADLLFYSDQWDDQLIDRLFKRLNELGVVE
jgi:glycerol-1-phosphate dehydrogenase [NAD(P)+]